MKKLFLALAALLMLNATTAKAYNESHKETLTELRSELAKVKTPKDSVKILYDIFDLASRDDYRSLAKEIYATAGRAKDTDTQLDIIRQVTAVINDEKEYDRILDEVKRIPASDDQRETKLFIEMKKISYKLRNISEEDRQKEITELITELESNKERDKYSKMLLLFKVVEYLRNDASAELLEQYIDLLVKMAESDQFSLYVLPNLIYSEATNIYTSAGAHGKAVEADRKLLEVIAGLEKKYDNMGRKYRNYDVNKFICYRRMLRNFEGLEPGEAQKIYTLIQEFRKSNWDVAKDIETNPYTYAFYYYATGAYAQSIPYLKLLYEKDPSVVMRKQVLELLIKAAEKTGDTETRLQAEEEYKQIEEEYERLNAEENFKTLQIRYQVKVLQEQNTALELENKEKDLKAARTVMIIIIVAFIILAIAMALSLFHWGRYKKNAHKLSLIANHMTHERNRLRHSIFFDDDDPEGEIVDQMQWKELVKKAKKSPLDISTFMTETIVNDLLHIAMLGKNNRDKHIHEVSVDAMMRRAVSIAQERNNNCHNLSVEYPEDDFMIDTDRDCLSLIVGHLLHATALNTPSENPVSLSVRHGEGKLKFIFTAQDYFNVTDESAVFDSILSIDEMVKIADSGLTVDRLIALLIESDLKHDKTYKGGARFIFTTPDNLSASC